MQEGASPIPSRSLCPGASRLFLADLSWCQRSSFQNSPWQGMKLGPQTVGWEGGRASGCFLCWEKLEEGGGRFPVPGVRWPRSRPLSSGQWDLLGAGGAPCVVPGTRGGGAGGWGPAWALPFLPFRGRETSPPRKGTWDPPFVLHLSLQPERESHHLKKSRQLISNESRNMPTSQAENGGWTWPHGTATPASDFTSGGQEFTLMFSVAPVGPRAVTSLPHERGGPRAGASDP